MKKVVYSIVLFSVLFGANIVNAMENDKGENNEAQQEVSVPLVEEVAKVGMFTRGVNHIKEHPYEFGFGTAGVAAGSALAGLVAYDAIVREAKTIKALYAKLKELGVKAKDRPVIVAAIVAPIVLGAAVTAEAVLRGENSWAKKGYDNYLRKAILQCSVFQPLLDKDFLITLALFKSCCFGNDRKLCSGGRYIIIEDGKIILSHCIDLLFCIFQPLPDHRFIIRTAQTQPVF